MPSVSKDPYANVPSYKLRPPTQESENSTIFKDFPPDLSALHPYRFRGTLTLPADSSSP